MSSEEDNVSSSISFTEKEKIFIMDDDYQFSEENMLIKNEKKEKNAKELLQHKLEKILEKLKDEKNENLDDFLENGNNKKKTKKKSILNGII